MKQSFYRKIRAQGYDIGTDQTEIINFYLEMWQQLGNPTPLLEPMSGTGINLIPFLEAGADIDGLDSSPFMLEICRQKCEAKGLRCNLYEQYIEQMELPRHYGFIFIPGGTYGHIHDKEVAAECLKRIYDHLLPGGWLGLDVRTPTDAVSYFLNEVYVPFEHFRQEQLYVLLLDQKNRITHDVLVYKGTVNAVNIRTAELFMEAVHFNSPSIIMAHNHPSGDSTPSPVIWRKSQVLLTAIVVNPHSRRADVEIADHT